MEKSAMSPFRVQKFCVSIAAVLTVLNQGVNECPAQNENADAEWAVRVYSVTDLILPHPDYPYDGAEIPTTGVGPSGPVMDMGTVSGGGGFGGGGFGGGGTTSGFGGGGGGGGGFFQVPDGGGFASGGGGFGALGGGIATGDAGLRFSMEDLIRAIQSTIEPMSWDVMGGKGVCTPLGGMLIIKQTQPVHGQIDALLTAIRDEGGAVHAVTLQAHWLLLGAEELDQLVDGGGRSPARVKRDVLQNFAGSRPGYQGRITCFSDQTVSMVSGRRRSIVVSAIPVVGGSSVAFQPVISLPNIGVLLEVKPTLLPDNETAVLNLVSTVTSAGNEDESVDVASQATQGSSTTLKLDRLSLDTQRLATTVRVPLGQPVLVGGLSLAGAEPPATAERSQGAQLYLVVELTADSDAR
jgi:hypothetical protein